MSVDKDEKKKNEDGLPSRLKIVTTLGYLIVAIVVAVIFSSLQGNRAGINDLRHDMEKSISVIEDDIEALDKKIDTEIDKLLESNRNRRNDTALLQERVASLEAQVDAIISTLD